MPSVKPGYRTTEFATTGAAYAISVLTLFMHKYLGLSAANATSLATTLGGLASLSYPIARAITKGGWREAVSLGETALGSASAAAATATASPVAPVASVTFPRMASGVSPQADATSWVSSPRIPAPSELAAT